MEKWTDEELQLAISYLKEGKTYKDIANIMNRSYRSVKSKLFNNNEYMSKYITFKIIECKNCENNIKISVNDKRSLSRKFCSNSCSATFNNKSRAKEINLKISKTLKSKKIIVLPKCKNCDNAVKQKKSIYCSNKCHKNYFYKEYIKRWKNGKEDGMRGYNDVSMHIRKYLFEKYDNKCTKCGWNKVNPYSNKIPLEVEHKDGNNRNNLEENLDLLCPSCHSLTETYKGANKGNGRKHRMDRYYEI